MKRNPQSPGFDFLGFGCFASAYKDKNDHVELITDIATDSLNEKEAMKKGGLIDSERNFYVVDMSREAMIRAREIAPASLKKFLPEITRLRIDIDSSGNTEFVYGMPFYDSWEYKNIKSYKYPTSQQYDALESIIWKSAIAIYRGSKYSANLKYDEDNPMVKIDGGELENLSESNEGIAKDGTVILRDPLVCLFFPHDAVRLFAKNFK